MVRLAEIAVFLVQGAEFRDGVVICKDKTRHDTAFYGLSRKGPLLRADSRGSEILSLKGLCSGRLVALL